MSQEEARLYALYLERKERISISRRKRSEEKRAAREAQNKSYYEGVEITKGVFLGNRLAALNSEWLCDNGITHVMNVTKDIQNYYLDERYPEDNDNLHPTGHVLVVEPEDELDDKDMAMSETSALVQDQVPETEKADEGQRIRYRRFSIEDSRDEVLPFDEIEAAVRFVQSAHIRNDGRALIHCREGKSRSVTVLLCYLMTAKRWPLERAFNHVKERAPWININEGFLKLLMDIEQRLFNSSSIDFFDKQDRKERIDYCEIDLEEELDRTRRRTNARSKKSQEKRASEPSASDVKSDESVQPADEDVAVSAASNTQADAVSAAVKDESPTVNTTSAVQSVSADTVTDTVTDTATDMTDTVASESIKVSPSPLQEVTLPAANSASEPMPAASEVSAAAESEDKENSGDVQNVGSSVLGKRKRDKPESKQSPAKKKKKVNNLPEPKVSIMSFFKRIE